MKGPTTDIAVRVVKITDKAIAVADGTMEQITDRTTGEVSERVRWFWFPKSLIEVDPEDYESGDDVVITVPERIATEKELV